MNETELLFTEILNCNRPDLYLNKDLHLDKEKSAFISSALKRRISGEPIQYILGKTEFMGLEFKVNNNVFIPRPETEILVEMAIKYITKSPCLSGRQASHQVTSFNILDIGTGSGCIAISLNKFLPNARISAVDISDQALGVAKENAMLNNVSSRINFIQGDLFNTYGLTPNTYGLIISNPPYIPTLDIAKLQPEINHEPIIALDGGPDGLEIYRKIISQAQDYLKEGGFLIMEMGFNQREAIKNIFKKYKYFEIIEVVKDYHNIDRVIVAQLK